MKILFLNKLQNNQTNNLNNLKIIINSYKDVNINLKMNHIQSFMIQIIDNFSKKIKIYTIN